VYCNQTGEWRTYRSDRFGFNNPDTVWDTAGAFDAVIIGDSFAQGQCVLHGEDVASLVRKSHPATLTMGVGGNGPPTELAALREYLGDQGARYVFWLSYEGNDPEDGDFEASHPYLVRYLDDPGILRTCAQTWLRSTRRIVPSWTGGSYANYHLHTRCSAVQPTHSRRTSL